MRLRRWTPVAASLAAAAAALTGLAGASAAAPSATAGTLITQVNPGWGLDRLDEHWLPLDQRYRSRSQGAGVTAYVIDGGVQTTNAEFEGRASTGVDLVGGSSSGCADELGVDHGTFVSGIIGGRTTGVAKKVKIVSVRALSCGEGQPSLPAWQQRALVIRAIDWVVDHGHKPAVVNMSLGFDSPSTALDDAMRRLTSAGFLAVVAAGNEDGSACAHYPAAFPAALTVAASTSQDRKWRDTAGYGSNYGRCVDVFAPGRNLRSVGQDGAFFYNGSGATSWATPYATGAVALYLSRHLQASPAYARAWVQRNATSGRLKGLPTGTPNRLLYTFGPLG